MMHFKQLELFIDEIEYEKTRQHYAGKAATLMIHQFQIRQECELSFILNVAKVSDNRKALMHWILVNTPETEYVDSALYNELAEKLRLILMDFENLTIH